MSGVSLITKDAVLILNHVIFCIFVFECKRTPDESIRVFISKIWNRKQSAFIHTEFLQKKKSKHLIFGLSGMKTPLTQATAEKHKTQELHIKALQTWRRSNKTFASW